MVNRIVLLANLLEFLELNIFLGLDAVFAVIIKRTAGLKFGRALCTRNALCFLIHLHEKFHLLLKMNTKAMNHTISLCQRSEIACFKRTGKLLVFFRICFEFRMLRTNMKIQRLLL